MYIICFLFVQLLDYMSKDMLLSSLEECELLKFHVHVLFRFPKTKLYILIHKTFQKHS